MDKYKVILVDDEEEVIDVIKQKIAWDQLGFQVVGSATNGVKALELVEKTQPDVVITDTKMPYMMALSYLKGLMMITEIFTLLYLRDLMNLNMQRKQFILRLKNIC